MNVLEKIARADPWRHSRLHDMRGNLIGARAVADIPAVLVWSAARELMGRRPALPWIPYDAIRRLAARVGPESRVLEFGSGMSTVWFASRCAFVHSIETDSDWYEKVGVRLKAIGLQNVLLELRTEEHEFSSFDEYPERAFDLVMVDGGHRRTSMETALRLVKPGGAIYLDNTDFGAQWDWYVQPEQLLQDAAGEGGARLTYLTGFPPATFVANQGLLAEWPDGSAPAAR
jgi:hypothetical protein